MKEGKLCGEWNRPLTVQENTNTGEVLSFERVHIGGKLLLQLHRHPKVGPLESVVRIYHAVKSEEESVKTVKFTNAKEAVYHDDDFLDYDYDNIYYDSDDPLSWI